jgi:hypothetical protein
MIPACNLFVRPKYRERGLPSANGVSHYPAHNAGDQDPRLGAVAEGSLPRRRWCCRSPRLTVAGAREVRGENLRAWTSLLNESC